MNSARLPTKLLPVLLLLILLVPGLALAAAGRMTFSIGDVRVERDGSMLKARRGFELEAGDTIHTGKGRAQIRFRDGGYISLQPDTRFRIDEYRFGGEQEPRSFFSLIRGGLRAITGLIGHRDRDRYRVRTPTVTIGIRGTGYTLLVDAAGRTHASVGEGSIVMRSKQGTLVLSSWQSGKTGPGGKPVPAKQRPYLPPQPLPLYTKTYQISDERDRNGDPTIVGAGGALRSGPGYVAGLSVDGTMQFGDGTATFETTSRNGLLQFQASPGTFQSASIGTAQPADTGSVNDNLGWGRWTGGTADVDGQGVGDLHYVVALPPATMPTLGTAYYALAGYTTPTGPGVSAAGGFVALRPTLSNVDVGAGPNDILTIDFGQGLIWASFDLVFGNGTANVDFLTGVNGPLTPVTLVPNADFAINNTACSGCSGLVVIGGNNAESAGVIYTITGAVPGSAGLLPITGAFGAAGAGPSTTTVGGLQP